MVVMLMTLFCATGAIAQVGTINAVPQVLSPDAAALGKYVEVPVSNYSGLPEINIPIYQLKTKVVDVPISLSYHASGVKVKEFPGWVGANWTVLNAGGVITRIIRGEPDDDNLSAPNFYKQNAMLLGTPPYYNPDPREMPGVTSEYTSTKQDTEFDIFYFNVMGHTGRITFDNAGQPYMMEVNDMKVEYNGSFVLTDAEGRVYEFNTAESYQWPNSYPYTRSWYLSKISIPDQDEEINFNYKKYSNNYFLYRYSQGPDSYSDRDLYMDLYPPLGSVFNPACAAHGRTINNDDLSQGETCVLRSITYKSDSIKFYHDTSRADNYKVRLDSICVFQGATAVHTTRFGYVFSNSSSSDFKDKKMLLSSVQSNDQPAYSCSYYGSFNGKSMPGPYVNGNDYWGFYNGQLYTLYTSFSTPRNPDYRYGQIGSLQTLTYPTGGNTEFTYEGNDFSYYQNDLDSSAAILHAGGLRIKKIKFTSPVGSSSFEKSYEYKHGSKSSGVLEAPFANRSASFYWGEDRPIANTYCSDDPGWAQICSFYWKHHDNVIPLGNAQGGVIGYAQVTEKNSDGSKTVMQYTNGGFDPYTYYPLLDPLLDGYGDGYNNDYLGDSLIVDRLTNDYSAFRGRLKNVAYYNSSGQKIRQEVYKFSNLTEDRLLFSQQHWTKNFYLVISPLDISWRCNWPASYYPNWGGYLHVQRNIVPTIDSLYTFNGTDTLKEVTKYDYSNPFYNLASRVIKVNPEGDSTVTIHKYPFDYSGPATDAFAQGVGWALFRNYLSQPVETYVVKKDAGGGNSRVTDAQLVQFKTLKPVPETVYKLSNTAGLTDFSPFSVAANPSTKDSRYKAEIKFNRYDGNGNVTEQEKDGQMKEVLVWGYKRRFVVARVSNSTYAAVIALVDSTVLDNPSSDAAMRTELNKIRTGLASTNPQAGVSTYTYATLKGLTSMTDPKGDTTYYEYDNYGRLKRGKDPDAYVKDNLWYHYKP